MADPIKLPPLPKKSTLYYKEGLKHGEASHAYGYTTDQLRARDLEVARVVLKAAANILSEHQIPVGNSAAGELACEWTYDALKECRDQINRLRFKHG